VLRGSAVDAHILVVQAHEQSTHVPQLASSPRHSQAEAFGVQPRGKHASKQASRSSQATRRLAAATATCASRHIQGTLAPASSGSGTWRRRSSEAKFMSDSVALGPLINMLSPLNRRLSSELFNSLPMPSVLAYA